MNVVDHFDITIPGPPVGKARARVTRHGTYTPAKTRHAENDIRSVWRAAGEPRLPDRAIHLGIEVHVTRPKSHYTTTGALSATGRRHPTPTRKPDLDNVAKSVADSLNGLAWRDDAQVADLNVTRRWADTPLIRVTAWVYDEEDA